MSRHGMIELTEPHAELVDSKSSSLSVPAEILCHHRGTTSSFIDELKIRGWVLIGDCFLWMVYDSWLSRSAMLWNGPARLGNGSCKIWSIRFWLSASPGPRPADYGRGTRIERDKALGRRQLEIPPKPHPVGCWHIQKRRACVCRDHQVSFIGRGPGRCAMTLRVVKHGQASRPPLRRADQQPGQPGCTWRLGIRRTRAA